MDFFKTLVWDGLVRLALSALFSFVPVLGWPVINQIVTWIVMHFAEQLYDAGKLAIDFQRIAFKNKELEREFTKAAIELRGALDAGGADSADYRRLRDAHKKALSDLIRISVG